MTGAHDEKLVLHAGGGLVVYDLLEEALFGLRGLAQDGVYPSFERRGVGGGREEVWALGRFPSHCSNCGLHKYSSRGLEKLLC